MENKLYKITLVCFNCGKKKDVFVNSPPQFAFELANIANKSGLKGVIDMNNQRSLVFCNDDCANNQKTKQGHYRLRPKKEKYEVDNKNHIQCPTTCDRITCIHGFDNCNY